MMDCKLNKETVEELTNKYGSPLYIFHEDEFLNNYQRLLATMRKSYSKYNIAYSYKTNYTPGVIKLVKQMGGLAEVVSEMEYELAKKIGYESKDIVYNGPVKGNGLFRHLMDGGVANIDSLDELENVVDFAHSHPNVYIRLAFRCNIDIGQGFISRFGLDSYDDSRDCELKKAFEKCKDVPNINVVGIHCHVGRSRSLEAWKNRINIIFKIVDLYFTDIPEFIDLGSGMNSVMEPELAKQFDGHIPTFEEYSDIVSKSMNEKYGSLPYEKRPWLYTEPGTTLISGCMSFLGRVESIKNVKSKDYVTFNCCGGNMGDICHLKNLPISVFHFSNASKKVAGATFVGYTCLEHDHIYEGFSGEIGVGDLVQFRNIGSYSNVFKPPFILPNCAMINLRGNGESVIFKQKEVFEDIFKTYVF